MTTPGTCPHANCTDPATKTFLKNAYCTAHAAMELTIHKLQYAPVDGVLNTDGTFQFPISDEMSMDPRVQRRMAELQPERDKRMAVVREVALKSAAARLSDATTGLTAAAAELKKAAGEPIIATATTNRAAADFIANLPGYDSARFPILKELAKKDIQLFKEVMDQLDAATPVTAQIRRGVWDLVSQKLGVTRDEAKMAMFSLSYDGHRANPWNNVLSKPEIGRLKEALKIDPPRSLVTFELEEIRRNVNEWYERTAPPPSPADAVAAMTAAEKVEPPVTAKESLSTRVIETAKEDGADIAYRVAARQFAKMARDPMATAFAASWGGTPREKKKFREQFGAWLETEAGLAFVMGISGIGMGMMPIEDERADALAKELRVAAGAIYGDAGMDLFMKPFREMITTFIGQLPMVKGGVRVDASTTTAGASKVRIELDKASAQELATEEQELATRLEAVRLAQASKI